MSSDEEYSALSVKRKKDVNSNKYKRNIIKSANVSNLNVKLMHKLFVKKYPNTVKYQFYLDYFIKINLSEFWSSCPRHMLFLWRIKDTNSLNHH